MSIAIFEDKETDRFIFEKSFERMNFRDYRLFENPDTGLTYAARESFRIVIIPLHFWGTYHGLDILRKWKAASKGPAAFIASTPLIQAGDEMVLERGFDRLVQKPMLYNLLDELIREPGAMAQDIHAIFDRSLK